MLSILKRALKRFPRLYALAQRIYPFATVVPALLRGRRGGGDHLRSTWSLIRGSTFVAGRPINITLEPANVCNLRCPVCETGSGELERSTKLMSLVEFESIIGKVATHTNTLMLYYMGETFLNGEAYQMIGHAKALGIPWVTTCTNGEILDPERLVASGIDEVSFQIGGMSAETHRIYRVRGDLERVLHNLRETLRHRRERRQKMQIRCGMILMRHNEHEVSLFRRTMAELGVDEAVVIDPCVRTIAQGEAYLPADERRWYYDKQAFQSGVLLPRSRPNNRCDWLNYSLVILANGDVVPCCRDPKGLHIMGNLLKQDLADIWNGERYIAFRKSILTEQGKVSICRLCSSYPASALN